MITMDLGGLGLIFWGIAMAFRHSFGTCYGAFLLQPQEEDIASWSYVVLSPHHNCTSPLRMQAGILHGTTQNLEDLRDRRSATTYTRHPISVGCHREGKH